MKKKFKTLLSSCLLILGILFLSPVQKAEAAGITQTDATTTSVSISWEADSYYTPLNYYIYVGTLNEDYTTTWTKIQTLPATQTSTVISDLTSGTYHRIKVGFEYLNYSKQLTEGTIGTSSIIYTLPGKVQNVKQDRWYYFILQFNATWDRQDAADGYQYEVRTSSGKKKASGTTSYNSIDVDKIKNNMIYTVRVRAYKVHNGKTVYGKWSTKCYCFTQPRIKKASVSKKKLTVKWSKVSGATGYDIYVSTNPTKGYRKVKSVSKKASSATISKFKGKKFNTKKKYYVYVVTKKKVGTKINTSGRLYYWNTKDSAYGYF